MITEDDASFGRMTEADLGPEPPDSRGEQDEDQLIAVAREEMLSPAQIEAAEQMLDEPSGAA